MPTIRRYRPSDLSDISEVCLRTGDSGEDATDLYDNHDLLPDVFARPYVVVEPELAFVVDDGGRAVGYILGTADTVAYVKWARETWLPQVAHRHPLPPGKPRNFQEFWTVALHNPEWMLRPEFADYPAHLHIDLLPEYQRIGLGGKLMSLFLDALRDANVPAVHLGYSNRNVRGAAFYRKMGFHVIEVSGAAPDSTYVGRST